MSTNGPTAPPWPDELTTLFDRAITCEYASLTASGDPVTVPVTPYVGETGTTLDVSTGLTYPAKAERARRNPKVALLFADPLGSGLEDPPTVLVQGLAAVRDADLQANTDRYVRVSLAKLPAVTKGQPRLVLRRMTFYYARLWVEITPLRLRWWTDRGLTTPPSEWSNPNPGPVPRSDPAPPGRPPPPWLAAPPSWHHVAAHALGLPLADLTVVDADGYPVIVPVRALGVDEGAVRLEIGPGAPELAGGPACLTLHSHPEAFTGQENHTLVGSLLPGPPGPRLVVERALADWSVVGNRFQVAVGFLAKGRRLAPRLKAEAARRGQPVPRVNLP
ncbi:MAG: pyridoxamine 5'-phosphate oxidase family protein [Acidimicrobiales bacterium]